MTDSPVVHVVDDDPSHLAAVCRLLRAAGFVVEAFPSGCDLLAGLSPETRGCVVADLRMPEVDGLQLQESLAKSSTPLPIVFLTGHGDIPHTVQAMRRGAVDFLEKRVPAEQLISAVALALDRDAATRLACTRYNELRIRFSKLTARELEVLQHVVRGQMNKQIAAALGIHERTVKLHRTAITRKVGVASAAALAVLAHRAGLFESQ
jgi:FixJ family two-component response regulator